MNKDNDWILDVVAEFLQSPGWQTAIINFIDKHCTIFEDCEENRLEYTPIHD
jgi:hypothetical protein